MTYELSNGRVVSIPDKEIQHNMQALDISKEEAIEMWLCDNDYDVSEEQEELEKKAKAVKIDHGARAVKPKREGESKPRERKADPDKEMLISAFKVMLEQLQDVTNVTIINVGKVIEFDMNGEHYKLDLARQRKKKG